MSEIVEKKLELSIIVPVYNEASRLAKTFAGLNEFIDTQPDLQLEIVFVNDGSKDQTKDLIEQYCATAVRHAHLIEYEANQGKGYAVRRGMLEARGAYRLMIDADMSTPLAEFEKFKPLMANNSQVVIGTRKGRGAMLVKKQPWYRQKIGETYALVAWLATGLKMKDFGCGFKMFSAEAAEKIFSKAKINRWTFDTEALYLAKRQGYVIEEVGVSWSNDEDTRVKLFKDIVQSSFDLIRILVIHFND